MLLMSLQAIAAAVAAAKSPGVMGASSRRHRRPARRGGARRGGGVGVGVALAVDAAVGRREDSVDLPERGDGLVKAQAECGEVVDRGRTAAQSPMLRRRRLGGGA